MIGNEDNPSPQHNDPAIQRFQAEVESAREEVRQSHENNLKLGQVIEQMAAKNRQDGDIDKIAYTNNVLAIREYQERASGEMSGYAKEIASSIESINTNNRKIAKSDQRAQLVQLERLRAMTETITDDTERDALYDFIQRSEMSIRQNTSAISNIASGLIKNMDIISGGITYMLSDSPILGAIAGWGMNKAKDAWTQRQDDKYAVQEARERQLSEQLGDQIKDEKQLEKMESHLAELVKKADDDNSKPTPSPETTKPEPTAPVKVNIPDTQPSLIGDSEGNMWLEALHDIADTSMMEVMQISETLTKMGDTSDTHFTMIEEILQPLVNGREEERRERNVFNERLLDALSERPALVDNDGKETGGSAIMDGILGAGLIAKGMTWVKGALSALVASGRKIFMRSMKFLVRSIPKLLGKIFVPAMIIGTLFSGVMEAVEVFNETGSIKEAAIGFFGGILDFITFGFFGTDQLNSVIDTVMSYADPILEMMKKPFAFLGAKVEEWSEKGMELKDDIIGKFDTMRDSMVEKLMTPIHMVGELYDSFVNGMKGRIAEMVKYLPDWAVPDSLVEWTKIEPVQQTSKLKEIMASAPEAAIAEKQWDNVQTMTEQLKNQVNEVAPTGNATVITDNSQRNITNIHHSAVTTTDPDQSLRFAQSQGGFMFGH